MVRFDMPSSRTNAKKGSKTVRIKTTKAEKKGFTVALAASASGEKLPAVVIFKERGGVLGARVQRQLHGGRLHQEEPETPEQLPIP